MPVINTNTTANTALRYLNLNSQAESSAMSKIASGSRITKASDDAAGLAIGTRIQSDITSISQAATNLSHANALMQTADGSEANIGDIAQRMKALATQSASGNVTDKERAYISDEFDQLKGEVDTIAKNTKYGGTSLLDGSFNETEYATANGNMISLSLGNFTSQGLGLDKLDVSSKEGAKEAGDTLNKTIGQITQSRATLGASMSKLEFSQQSIMTDVENSQAANSQIVDADVAAEKAKLSSQDVKTQAAIAALSQANAMPAELLGLLR